MSALSKRQQARNERTLQDLIVAVPGNDRCADCHARNPGWGSWNLGIFLCMRCATLHRKLGTHISKVKSLTMDSWSADQVETMRTNGNVAVNKVYNPRNVKPAIPVDVDEVDAAMERFLRKKYELRALEDGKPKPPSRLDPSYTVKPPEHHSATTAAVDAPAPKAKSRARFGFGLRSISSSSLSASSRRRESVEVPAHALPLPSNKQSRTLGASIADRNGPLEPKLDMLRDMGFRDHKRNATILKGLNGDLERAIDTLTRLGEKSSASSSAGVAAGTRSPTSTSSPYRTSSGSTDAFTPPSTSSNPFDRPPATSTPIGISLNRTANATNGSTPLNRTANTTGGTPLTKTASNNPFESSLVQSFQSLQVSQPLFPNMTGGYPSQGPVQPLRPQQSVTPPVQSPQNTFQSYPQGNTFGVGNGSTNPFLPQSTGTSTSTPNSGLSPTNPFFSQSAQHMSSPHQYLQHHNTMPSLPATYMSSIQQQQQQPFQQQQPMFQQQPFQQQPFQQQPFQQPTFQQQQQQQQQQQPYQPRLDKSSILALYNFSQPPPTIMEQPQTQPQPQTQIQPTSTNPYHSPAAQTNPFFANQTAPPAANPGYTRTHMSQESIDIRQAQSGRHSPDIFASLSARY